MPRKIETFFIAGPAGRLEAILEEPEHMEPRESVLVCHPHPLYGGTMHNKVVHRLARGMRRTGAAALRFNFRGVNLSEGAHDRGAGELEDARSCLEWLRARYPDLPYSLAGFSFGSRVILRLGCGLGTVRRMIAAGVPTRHGHEPALERCRIEKIFIQSTRDQYGPKEELERLFAKVSDPKRLVWVESNDHFFAGGLEQFENAVFRIASGG